MIRVLTIFGLFLILGANTEGSKIPNENYMDTSIVMYTYYLEDKNNMPIINLTKNNGNHNGHDHVGGSNGNGHDNGNGNGHDEHGNGYGLGHEHGCDPIVPEPSTFLSLLLAIGLVSKRKRRG